MKKIPFSTVEYMHAEIREELDAAYHRVIDSAWFIRGRECQAFEEEYAACVGTGHCVGVASGLDAIQLILKAMDIGPGDEVIVPANTFIATALAVSYVGATPVLVDPAPDSCNMDPSRIEAKITPRTKCIIPVHLQGRCADMDPITDIAQRHGLKVVEDAAQAHGARYKGRMAGTMSDAAAFSFYPGKNLGAMGDAGCVVTDNQEIADRVRMLGNYGSSVKYHHVYKGINSRLDELQAALLRVKLPHLERWNADRIRTAERYFQGIRNPEIILPLQADDIYASVFHVFAIRHRERDRLEKYLADRGIETVKHYPIPIHLQEAYADLGIREGEYPVAEEIAKTTLSIPLYYGMADEEADTVIEALNAFHSC